MGGQSPKKIVSHMYKYAVFDIKLTYNHYIFITGVQLSCYTQQIFHMGAQTHDCGGGHLPSPLKTTTDCY